MYGELVSARTSAAAQLADLPPLPVSHGSSHEGQSVCGDWCLQGIGRGIALQLCKAGATVYITGRHLDTLRVAAQEAQSLGGRCVPVVCDSSQESEVRSLFEQVDREQQGHLDVLVNNAYAGVQTILNRSSVPSGIRHSGKPLPPCGMISTTLDSEATTFALCMGHG